MLQCEIVTTQQLWNEIASGAVILASSVRYADALRTEYECSQREQRVIETPAIYVYQHWLNKIWEECLITGQVMPLKVLSSAQQALLWEEVVAASESGKDLIQREGTARLARNAWLLMQQWQVDINEDDFHYNEDSRAFYQWYLAFGERCKDLSVIAEESLADQLIEAFKNNQQRLTQTLLVIGFDELTPQTQSLLAGLSDAGAHVRWLEVTSKRADSIRVEAEDPQQEIEWVARWLRQRLDDDPHQKLAVVVHDISAQRQRLLRSLDEFLNPQALAVGQASVATSYNLSLGLALNEYPIIDVALKILSLSVARLSAMQDLTCILNSPFIIGWDEERYARAMLDARLRERGELKLSLATLEYYAREKGRAHYCPIFAEQIKLLIAYQKKLLNKAGLYHWSELLMKVLSICAWSSGRSLSSVEYQTVEVFKERLSHLAGLDVTSKRWTCSQAIMYLTRLCKERIFQPESGVAPIQILGVLEAANLSFDAIWIMGMNDVSWPPPCRPDAFIPITLQRQHNLPHSASERVLQMATRSLHALMHAANEVIVSYPLGEGDESFSCSPMFVALPCVKVDELAMITLDDWRARIHQSACLEAIVDERAPALQTDQPTTGGSGLFKDQAACPFRAFAQHRLRARELGKVSSALPATSKGSIVHHILEIFWNEVSDLDALNRLTTQQLQTQLKTCIEKALEKEAQALPQILSPAFQVLEKKRLLHLIMMWLELEQSREYFKVVSNEQKFTQNIAGIEVNLKIDRIDQLADGSLVVIDYKTGKVDPKQWFGERLDEPQLPLYSMVVDGDVSGISYAVVKLGEMMFRGVMAKEELLPGVKSYADEKNTAAYASWDDLLIDWRNKIEGLAQAFCAGEAQVDPKDKVESCKYCALDMLCRIET